MNSIFTRRSIRHFKDIPLTQEQIEHLLRAGFQAPSARNLQPWEFIVVTDRQRLNEMADLAPSAKPLKGAALGIVVCGNLKKDEYLEFCEQDLAAATENMLLEAHDMGLGGVWIGMHPAAGRAQRLKVVFRLPEHIFPFWMIAFGYPDEEGKLKDNYDPSLIHYEQW